VVTLGLLAAEETGIIAVFTKLAARLAASL
jgi:hypothetical protein